MGAWGYGPRPSRSSFRSLVWRREARCARDGGPDTGERRCRLRGDGRPGTGDRGALDPVAETLADSHSYGFRIARSTADAIAHCFTILAPRRGPEWILEGDIQACFDRIDHDWLLAHVPQHTPAEVGDRSLW
jgi:hypothetical protein